MGGLNHLRPNFLYIIYFYFGELRGIFFVRLVVISRVDIFLGELLGSVPDISYPGESGIL